MKHLLLAILLAFSASLCNAQTEHMKFKGIPMEGTLQTFTAKLKAKGYTPTGTINGVAQLTGEFAGYKNCTIDVVTDKSGEIYKVSVMFPVMNKWSDLEECYMNYKSLLTEKYGEPESCTEKFLNEIVNLDNNSFSMLKYAGCTYVSKFKGNNGSVKLQITYKNHDCYVVLDYLDKANQSEFKKQVMDDL